ncbi:hypothetical protein H2509_12525 [Stappia sp. F7233]|uniref:Uncharacterized protein n=1 Tax=Stappia albiluteola TaxID=2758565 RepID=A0A839AHG1_9HYPH|nr:hypothetical protein [Stappia albiluteola]MBA5777949.1 hypothetical protein [Stappia albiluteola]
MIKRPILAGLFLALAFASTCAAAEDDPLGFWEHNTVSGVERFRVHIQASSSFTIWCKKMQDGYAAILDIDIDGRSAPADQLIHVVFDGALLKLRADSEGNIRMNCPYCADQMTWIWGKLRSGRTLQVAFDDDRYAAFGLTTAPSVLGHAVCTGK